MTDGLIGAAPTETDTATEGESRGDGVNDNEFNDNEFNGMNGNGAFAVVRPDPLTKGTVWEPVIFIERICATASVGTEAEHNEKITASAAERITCFSD